MDKKQHIATETEYLFNCDFFADDFDPEGNEEHLDRANMLLEKYPWSEVFDSWSEYLYEKCETPEAVINYCNLFFYYGGHDQFISDPYKFLGFIFYRVDVNKYWDQAGDILDSISIALLEKSGNLSLINEPYYQPWNDPKIKAEVDKYNSLNKKTA